MKSLKAKRIAAVAAGAALLGIGLAFAGPITFQNVPIINNAGQPVVQVVLGSSAKPADGVSAANIAAAIGNLAFTSVPVTASINASQAQSVLKPVVSTTGYTLANQQVYFNESSSSYVSGTYSFSALIGSVLNRAVKMNQPLNTKTLQTSASGYAYSESNSLTVSPVASPYFFDEPVPYTTVSGSVNGGGVSFTSGFVNASSDNILRVTPQELPALMNNVGANGESEYLWVTGFPVYDQNTNAKTFELKSAGGAYQAVFNKPISYKTGSNAVNNAQISLLGQNWTILNYELPGASAFNSNTGVASASSTSVVNGGMLQLASSLSPLSTVFVGQNITSGPFKVELTDIGRTTNGLLPAAVNVYYNGALVNTTAITPPSVQKFNVSNHTLYVKVNSTFAGYYAYTKYAKMQLYSNVMNVTSGSVFNKTTNPGWNTELLWTNTTSGIANELQGIVIFNETPTSLKPGQSFNFITSPSLYKLTFDGQSLSSSSYDPVSITSSQSSETYENAPTNTGGGVGNINNITMPAQLLTVTSQIPNAFSYSGQTGSSILYDLTPYQLTESHANGNTLVNATATISISGNYVSSTYPLQVTVKGARTNGSGITTLETVSLTNSLYTTGNFPAYNVTSITLNRALPGVTVDVNTIEPMASLTTLSPQILYSVSGKNYMYNTSAANVIYNQQNGQPTTNFALTKTGGTYLGTMHAAAPYFEYTMNEIAVPSQSSSQDQLAFDIYNSTSGPGASPLFQLNNSVSGTPNNMTYSSTSGANVLAPVGFYTERGSKVATISRSALTVDFAKAVDMLQFSVGPSNVTAVTLHQKMVGPVGIGQAIPGIPNVTVAAVNASVAVSGKNYSISGISNIVATPSVSSATEPVMLKNMTVAGSPSALVVLDSQANPSSNLILIGSGFVNTLSAQLQSSYNVSVTPTTQIDAAYGSNRILIAGYYANQTTAAANSFIQALYAKASTT